MVKSVLNQKLVSVDYDGNSTLDLGFFTPTAGGSQGLLGGWLSCGLPLPSLGLWLRGWPFKAVERRGPAFGRGPAWVLPGPPAAKISGGCRGGPGS